MEQATSTSEYFGIFDGWKKEFFWLAAGIIIAALLGLLIKLLKKGCYYYLRHKTKRIICEVGIERADYPFPESYYIKFYNKYYYISRDYISKKIADNTQMETVQETRPIISNAIVDSGSEVTTNSSLRVEAKTEINFGKEDLKDILETFYLKKDTEIRLYNILKQKLRYRKNLEIILENGDRNNEIFKVAFDKLNSEDFDCPGEYIKIINHIR